MHKVIRDEIKSRGRDHAESVARLVSGETILAEVESKFQEHRQDQLEEGEPLRCSVRWNFGSVEMRTFISSVKQIPSFLKILRDMDYKRGSCRMESWGISYTFSSKATEDLEYDDDKRMEYPYIDAVFLFEETGTCKVEVTEVPVQSTRREYKIVCDNGKHEEFQDVETFDEVAEASDVPDPAPVSFDDEEIPF